MISVDRAAVTTSVTVVIVPIGLLNMNVGASGGGCHVCNLIEQFVLVISSILRYKVVVAI